MTRYIQGIDRSQVTLLPECLDDFIAEDNTVREVDAFIGELDLAAMGFEGVTLATKGRPSYHPSVQLTCRGTDATKWAQKWLRLVDLNIGRGEFYQNMHQRQFIDFIGHNVYIVLNT